MTKLTAPLKWHGGKNYLAPKIVALMPPRCQTPNKPADDDPGWLHYVEPFFGGGAVLLANDPEGISEVANDLNHELINFWSVLAFRDLFEQFCHVAQCTPFAEAIFEGSMHRGPAANETETDARLIVQRAARFFVRCRQSLAGRMKGFTGVTKTRTRRGMNNEVSAWLSCVEGLPAVHERLKRVLILNRDALEVIRGQDGTRTLFYLDPPYLPETRATTGEYAHEMSYDQHRELLEALKGIQGRFLLSGYDSDLYRGYAHGWNRHEFDIANHAAGGESKRRMTEVVWTNY